MLIVNRAKMGDDMKAAVTVDHLIPIDGSTFLFSCGPIGAGKSRLIHNLVNCKRVLPEDAFPQPIEEIRKLTTGYYGTGKSFEEVNVGIQTLCLNNWSIPLKARTQPLPRLMVAEQTPPPFHRWIFEWPFTTSLDELIEQRDEAIGEDPHGVINELIRSYAFDNHIMDALIRYPELACFNTLAVCITIPSLEQERHQLSLRARPEETVLSGGYLSILRSKYQRAIWEIIERPKLSANDQWEWTKLHLTELMERFI